MNPRQDLTAAWSADRVFQLWRRSTSPWSSSRHLREDMKLGLVSHNVRSFLDTLGGSCSVRLQGANITSYWSCLQFKRCHIILFYACLTNKIVRSDNTTAPSYLYSQRWDVPSSIVCYIWMQFFFSGTLCSWHLYTNVRFINGLLCKRSGKLLFLKGHMLVKLCV